MQNLIDKQARLLSYLDQDPENFSLLADIFECACQLQDESKANHYLDRAQQLNSNQAMALEGLFHLSFNRPKKAINALERAQAIADQPAIRHNLSFCYLYEGQIEQAEKTLEPLMPLADNMPEVYLLMARIQHHLGHLENACYFGEQYLAIAAENEDILGLLAIIYFDLENMVQAEAFAHRALALCQTNADALSVRTLIDLHSGKMNLEQLEKIVENAPNDIRLLWALGQSYLIHHAFDQSVTTLKQVCALAPEFIEAQTALAFAFLLTDQLMEAESYFQAVLAIETDNANALGGLALVAILSGQLKQADKFIKQALFLEMENGLALLANSLLTIDENPAQAKAFLRQGLQTMLAESGLQFNANTEKLFTQAHERKTH